MIRIRAVNTAADRENKIHDDRVAAEYGFKGGLVPGVTIYGYLAEGALEHFGPAWLERGAMDVRFQDPVYDGDEVNVSVHPLDNGRISIESGFATATAWMHDNPVPALRSKRSLNSRLPAAVDSLPPGTILGSLEKSLDLAQSRMSAPLDPAIGPDRIAHPAILLALANQVFIDNYELGPWIHASSEVRKFSSAKDGETISVHAKIEDRFERKGHEFVILDVLIAAGPRIVESVRHTAIWRPRIP
jgi:hypothetical protein